MKTFLRNTGVVFVFLFLIVGTTSALEPPPPIDIAFKYLEVDSKVGINFSQTLKVNAVFEPDDQSDGSNPMENGLFLEYQGEEELNPLGKVEPCFIFFFRPEVFVQPDDQQGESITYKFKFAGGQENIAFFAYDPINKEVIKDFTPDIKEVKGILELAGGVEPCFLKFTIIAEAKSVYFNSLAGASAIRLVFPDSKGNADGGSAFPMNLTGFYE